MKKFVLLVVSVFAALSIIIAAVVTFGSAWITRTALDFIAERSGLVIRVGGVRGSIFSPLELTDVTVVSLPSDTIVRTERLTAAYRLLQLIRGKYDFRLIAAQSMRLQLRPAAEDVGSETDSVPAGGFLPDISVRRLNITDGAVYVAARTAQDSSYTVEEFELNLTDVAIRDGGRFVGAEVGGMSGRLRYPRVHLTHLQGALTLRHDTLWIDMPRVELTEATGRVQGWLLPSDTRQKLDMTFSVMDLTPADFPVTPEWLPDERFRIMGKGRLSVDDGYLVASDSVRISVDATPARIVARGNARLLSDNKWELSNSVINLTAVPSFLLSPFVDTTLISGNFDGRISASGPAEGLRLDMDIAYADTRDRASSSINAAGEVSATRPDDIVMQHMTIRRARVDLRTVSRFFNRVPAAGAVNVFGDMRGPIRAPTFRGVVAHTNDEWPSSVVQGEVRGMDYADLRIDSLQPQLIQAFFSRSVPVPGVIDGRVELQRARDTLQVNAAFRSVRAGSVEVAAGIVPSDTTTTVHGTVTIDGADASAFDSLWPATVLNGSGSLQAVHRDRRIDRWHVAFGLDSSHIQHTLIEQLDIDARGDDDVITVDSIMLRGTGLAGSARGIIHVDDTAASRVFVAASIDSLQRIVMAARPWIPASLDSVRGSLTMEGTVTGTARDYAVSARATGTDLGLRTLQAPSWSADLDWWSSEQSFGSLVQMDTLSVGTFVLSNARIDARGIVDSTTWVVRGERPRLGLLYSSGQLVRHPGVSRIQLDSVSAPVGRVTWSLLQPTEIRLEDSTFAVDSLVLRVPGRDARVELHGTISPHASSQLRGRLINVRLEDVATFLGQDSVTFGGRTDVAFDVTGTLREPQIAAQASVTAPRVRGTRFSRTESTIRFADGRLRIDASLDTDTARVADLRADLPVHVELTPLQFEKGEGEISVSIRSADAPLSIAAPFFPAWRNPQGVVVATATMGGTWSDPVLGGEMSIRDGRVTLSDLGIQLDSLDARFELRGDSVAIQRFVANSGAGTVRVGGNLGLRDLTNPSFAITATTDRFTAIDRRDYMTMVVTGQVRLGGSLAEPRVTGSGVANRGTISFADVLEKQIVDLSDSLFAAYIDTSVIRQEGLGQLSTSELLRRLQIDTLRVNLGNDFWMRSGEGDVQLTGDLTINKRLETYRLDGTLTAARGTYRLQLAPGITREFTVTRGTVRYFGTPDLNADLDIDARHTVRTFGGNPVNISAHLGGTLYQPTVQLSSDIRPPVSDAELISYLLFGSPSVQAFAGQGGTQSSFLFRESVDQFAAALSGQLAESVVRGLGVPLDYLEIKPGDVSRSFSGTEIALGKQFSLFNRPAFVTASPRICPRQSFLSAQNLGASLESRITGRWSLSASVDPVRVCETSVAPFGTTYQLGVDLIWERR